MLRATIVIALVLASFACPRVQAGYIYLPPWNLPRPNINAPAVTPAHIGRPTVVTAEQIGLFALQSEVGIPNPPGSSSYDPAKRCYAICSAGSGISGTSDQFRYVSRPATGDARLETDIAQVQTQGEIRGVTALVIRQNLAADSPELALELEADGSLVVATRKAEKDSVEENCRIPPPTGEHGIVRLALEKRGDRVTLYATRLGAPLSAIVPALKFHLKDPYQIGVGVWSHRTDYRACVTLSRVSLAGASPKP